MEKIKFEDGQLVRPAYVIIDNIEHEVTPAVYEGNTPLSSYNLNKMQEEILEDGIIVSPTEPTTDRRKVWFKYNKNILPTDFNAWVSGQYNLSTGVAEDSAVRIRLNFLLKMQAGETYYFNTFSDYQFIIRTYDKNGAFSRNIGGVENGSTVTINADEGYLGVTLYKLNGTTTYPLYNDYKTLFENKTIKPMICLNSEKDKSFQEYINNAIYVKNNNDVYEEFIKKQRKEEKNIMTAFPSGNYTTTSKNNEKLTLVNSIKIGNGLSVSNGGIKIGKGISYVKASAQFIFSSGITSGDVLTAYIYKNSNSASVGQIGAAGISNITLAESLIEVQENDVLYLYVKDSTNTGAVVNLNSRLTVEAV